MSKMTTVRHVPPDIEWQLEASYEDTLSYLPGAVAEGMLPCCSSDESETEPLVSDLLASVTVQTPVFLSIIVWRIILVEPWWRRSSDARK